MPVADMRALRDALGGGARLVEISSSYGHDAFLKEKEVLGGVFAQALDRHMTQEANETDPCRAGRARDRHPARGGRAADPPDVDVRLRRVRAEARLRLFAIRQSHTRRARGRGRRPGGRDRGGDHVLGHGGGDARRAALPARRSRSRAARLLRRHIPALQRAARARRAAGALHRVRGCGRARACARGTPRAGLDRDAVSNPLLRIVDIARVARAGRSAGALVVADNTFLSPVWQKPLRLGADVVVHSTTKYLNGHSDVVGGAVIAATPELHERFAWWGNCIGVTGAPFDAYLTLRGLRTLHARMRSHGENAARVASMLAAHPAHRARVLPGPSAAPRSRARAGAATGIRRDGQLRARRRPGARAGVSRSAETFLAGGIAGRCRKPGRASGQHDARGNGARGRGRAPASLTGCCGCRSVSRTVATWCAISSRLSPHRVEQLGKKEGRRLRRPSGTGPEQPQSVRH